METPLQILNRYWNHESFKPLQEQIINSVIEGNDTLALLPTGGGKSICFQVPTILKDGICIVISPLIALMKDQVESLNNKGIKAIALTSGISYNELDALLDNCVYGNYKFLYLSPERLQQEMVQDRIRKMNVSLIAVDEAHCISQWGNDFRPAYKNITILREFLPSVPIIALTATATPKVVSDIKENLQLKDTNVFKNSFKRDNIFYQVFHTQDKHHKLLKALTGNTTSAIVYVRSRGLTVELSNYLNNNNLEALAFHGGLTLEQKENRLKKWLNNSVQVMVATNAFGMGIDKPDVNRVIHFNLPDSIESYYQEAGRAGRNGEQAKAIILMNKSDELKLKEQFLSVLPDVATVKLVYKKLCNYFQIAYGEGEHTTYQFEFNTFCKTYELNTLQTYHAIQILDRNSILSISNTFNKKTTLQFLVSSNQVLDYLNTHEQHGLLVKAILRTYGGVFDQKTKINLALLSKKTGVPEKMFISTLEQLFKDELIDLEIAHTDSELTFITPREDDKTINRIAPVIKQQNELKQRQVQAVIEYVNNNSVCKSVQLLTYFGETEAAACGNCSVCSNTEKPKASRETIKNSVIKNLESGAKSSKVLTDLIPYSEKETLLVLQLLLEHNIIVLTKQNTYKLAHL